MIVMSDNAGCTHGGFFGTAFRLTSYQQMNHCRRTWHHVLSMFDVHVTETKSICFLFLLLQGGFGFGGIVVAVAFV